MSGFDPLDRKLLIRLMPLLVLCFFFAYVDRVNVSFAAGDMRHDLMLSGTTYGLGAGIFFIGYVLFEMPGNYILGRLGARLWLSVCMIAWGLVSAGMAFVGNGTEFLTMRFVLGMAESGFYPGILFFLMQAFPAKLHVRVISYLIVVIPVASAVSSLLASVILHLNGMWTLHGWQWLFLIEGLPSIFLGGLLYYYLPERLEQAAWLTEDERVIMASRLASLRTSRQVRSLDVFLGAFRLPVVWKIAAVFFCISFVSGTIHFWLPQMIAHAGFERHQVLRLATIPYFAGALALLVCVRRTDTATDNRRILSALVIACLALWGITLTAYIAGQGILLTLATAALFVILGLMWGLPGRFLHGMQAAAGVALINSFGNLGNFFGPVAFAFLAGPTAVYARGLVMDALMLGIAGLLYWTLTRKKTFAQREETS
ncbi:MFS transporter [Gluconobacter sp. Dm-62]|nr:MFS transporter [Gluconobacter sp. Dm-62]